LVLHVASFHTLLYNRFLYALQFYEDKNMAKIKLGLIGYGYWGPNIARLLNESTTIELAYCADLLDASLKQVKKKYPRVTTTKDYHDILKDKSVTGVCIVTPTKTHFQIAKECLEAKKHVFIEKPLTSTSEQAKELIKIAQKNKVILSVGHVFLFNPAVKFIKKTIDDGTLGTIRYFHFQRRSLGPIRKDVNVLWDLAPHDLSMLLYFVQQKPVSVIATGQSYLQKAVHDVVSASIKFEDNILANLILSWIDPIKIRDITIVGSKKMLLFDDVHTSEKIKIFDKNANIIEETRDVTFGEYQIALHSGDISIPAIENKEPLKEEIHYFVECITENRKPINDGNNGLAVVKILEALQESLENNSKVVTL
jgi:predicted dehydrogenase